MTMIPGLPYPLPPIVAVPDVVDSVRIFLSSVPEVAALVSSSSGWAKGSGPRISGSINRGWKVPSLAIVLRRAGGAGIDETARHVTRLDVRCLAGSTRDAAMLWRTVHAALAPRPPGITGWAAASCRVTDVEQDADPIPDDDTDVGWYVLVAPYLFSWYEMAVTP